MMGMAYSFPHQREKHKDKPKVKYSSVLTRATKAKIVHAIRLHRAGAVNTPQYMEVITSRELIDVCMEPHGRAFIKRVHAAYDAVDELVR